jgi:hypothetical protein
MSRYSKRRRRAGGRLLLLFILLLAILTAVSNYVIVTTEYTVSGANLPSSFDGYRIAQLSDVHAAEFFNEENLYLVSQIEDAQPDLIVITGDLIDEKEDYSKEGLIAENLISAITRIAPVMYVTGNHEWATDHLDELLEMMKSYGVTVLQNEYVLLEKNGESIVVAGVDDPCGYADMKTVDALMEEIQTQQPGKYTVLLSHRNDKIDTYADLGFDLVLCGHAHGGVVRLPGTDGLIGSNREWFPDYTSGLYTQGSTSMVVSRGIGNHTGVPRFLNNPHIPVAVLKST